MSDLLFENCLKYYFDYSVLPHSFTFIENRNYLDESIDRDKINEINLFIQAIKDILDKNKSKFEEDKGQIIKNDYQLFNIEIINGQKTMLFKFSDFMFYAYGCYKISFNFFDNINKYFQSDEHFGLYNDVVEYSKHGKPDFKTKYQDKDIEISSKYSYILETDISNYYPSIYTHMFARCLDEDNPLNKCKSDTNKIGGFIDSFIQRGQNNETNGVPIGSMLYRIFVEILSIYIDSKLIKKLTEKNIEKTDYEGCRIVDDRFIGFKTKAHAEICLNELRQILHSMRLSVNDSKTKISHINEIFSEPWKKDFDNISLKKKKHILQLDKDIFFYYNNIKDEKEKNKMFKYVITAFGNKLNQSITNQDRENKNIDESNYYLLHKLFLIAPNYCTFLFQKNILKEITKNEKFGKLFFDTAIDIIKTRNSYQNGEIIGCLMIIKFYLKSFPIDKIDTKYYSIIKKISGNKCPFIKAIWHDIRNKGNKKYDIKEDLIKNDEIRNLCNFELYNKNKSANEQNNPPKRISG